MASKNPPKEPYLGSFKQIDFHWHVMAVTHGKLTTHREAVSLVKAVEFAHRFRSQFVSGVGYIVCPISVGCRVGWVRRRTRGSFIWHLTDATRIRVFSEKGRYMGDIRIPSLIRYELRVFMEEY